MSNPLWLQMRHLHYGLMHAMDSVETPMKMKIDQTAMPSAYWVPYVELHRIRDILSTTTQIIKEDLHADTNGNK